MQRVLALSAVVVVVMSLAGPARAATAQVETHAWSDPRQYTLSHRLVIEAKPGEANRIRVSFDAAARSWHVQDDGAPISAGRGCAGDAGSVTCATVPPPGFESRAATYSARVVLGDRDDQVAWAAADDPVALEGGDGADEFEIADGRGTVTLVGGPGGDVVDSERADVSLDYSDHAQGINVTPDGVADDGAPGEGDNVMGRFGEVRATPFDDHLEAGQDPVRIAGGDGDDTILGGPGGDRLEAGRGDNVVDGGGGDDEVTTSARSTGGELSGGSGRDQFSVTGEWPPSAPAPFTTIALDGLANDGPLGGRVNVRPDFEDVRLGRGRIVGGDGPERLFALDGVDGGGGDDQIGGTGRLTGGPGRDQIDVSHDVLATTVDAYDGEADTIVCESDGRLPGRVYAGPIDTAPGCAPELRWAQRTRVFAPDRRGYVSVRLACPVRIDVRCTGRVLLRDTRGVVHARGSIRELGQGRSARVRLKVAAGSRALLRRGRRLLPKLVVYTTRTEPAAERYAKLGTVALRR